MLARGEGAHGAREQQVMLGGRLVFGGQPVCGLEHHRGRSVGRVVLRDGVAVAGDGDRLGDRVEGAPLVALQVDGAARFEPGPEPRGRAADPLGHGPDLAAGARQDGDDPVCLTEVVRAKDDPLVAVERHWAILPRRADNHAQVSGFDTLASIPLTRHGRSR
jgi:hypothetical protein